MEQALVISTVLLWAVVLFSLLLTLAVVRRVNAAYQDMKPAENGLKESEQAPEFAAQTLDGETVTLSSFAGKPTAFVFISHGCKPCHEELPNYLALQPVAEQAGAQLVLVSIDTPDSTRELVNEFQISTPILVAQENINSFMRDYKMKGTPAYTYVDAEGKVKSAGRPNKHMDSWKQITASWEADKRELVGALPTGVSSNGRR
jgi:peroxiredoxin